MPVMPEGFMPESFVDVSRALAEELYRIMNANIDIPAADLAVILFRYSEKDYLGLLKMNYKSSYTHFTVSDFEMCIRDRNTEKLLLTQCVSFQRMLAFRQSLKL